MTAEQIECAFSKIAIAEVIQDSARLLDAEDFESWLHLFDDASEYEMTTYSHEIRKTMSWWKSDKKSLTKILKEVPRHVRDLGRDTHLVTPLRIEVDGEKANAISNFVVLRTALDGQTRLYVAGRYEDVLIKKSGRWLYSIRKAVLQTRVLDGFTHVPL